uniref:Uncharacterized protein n=1 Tax=Amphiprion percula TaxID=161767 RepID=A0A3P8SCE1_AMPPE
MKVTKMESQVRQNYHHDNTVIHRLVNMEIFAANTVSQHCTPPKG